MKNLIFIIVMISGIYFLLHRAGDNNNQYVKYIDEKLNNIYIAVTGDKVKK